MAIQVDPRILLGARNGDATALADLVRLALRLVPLREVEGVPSLVHVALDVTHSLGGRRGKHTGNDQR